MAFSAFVAFKGLKRPKKAEKKTFAKWLRIVQFGEKSNKKNFPSQIFFDLCDLGASWSLTLVAFFWEKSGFWGSRKLVLKKVLVAILCFFVRCSLIDEYNNNIKLITNTTTWRESLTNLAKMNNFWRFGQNIDQYRSGLRTYRHPLLSMQ